MGDASHHPRGVVALEINRETGGQGVEREEALLRFSPGPSSPLTKRFARFARNLEPSLPTGEDDAYGTGVLADCIVGEG